MAAVSDLRAKNAFEQALIDRGFPEAVRLFRESENFPDAVRSQYAHPEHAERILHIFQTGFPYDLPILEQYKPMDWRIDPETNYKHYDLRIQEIFKRCIYPKLALYLEHTGINLDTAIGYVNRFASGQDDEGLIIDGPKFLEWVEIESKPADET